MVFYDARGWKPELFNLEYNIPRWISLTNDGFPFVRTDFDIKVINVLWRLALVYLFLYIISYCMAFLDIFVVNFYPHLWNTPCSVLGALYFGLQFLLKLASGLDFP